MTGDALRHTRELHKVAESTRQALASDNPGATIRVGYHSVPSMRPLHLHIISQVSVCVKGLWCECRCRSDDLLCWWCGQDFVSPAMKTKKHYLSFTTAFFLSTKVGGGKGAGRVRCGC